MSKAKQQPLNPRRVLKTAAAAVKWHRLNCPCDEWNDYIDIELTLEALAGKVRAYELKSQPKKEPTDDHCSTRTT
jgi:hypothetical protein